MATKVIGVVTPQTEKKTEFSPLAVKSKSI